MNSLTEKQIRASLVNASRREAASAVLPDLAELPWERLDYLGWRDRRAPLTGYVVVELDGDPTGVLLRASPAPSSGRRRKAMCVWCRDVATVEATLYVARRGGASGRAGNTIGTLICEDFTCSRNARRPPTSAESGTGIEAVADQVVAERIAGLRERSAQFVRDVAATG
ncbi:FBP domain-containing protein [Blastococcus haudaquaticus]|uniref:FBP C-terminal treble-clef zinc-finger n=1 Tax=Blastococcus haudaquaticus TaxID=1938745 RepID=A0A286GTC8_9ACTN|nr:FBP domain-containing protein [Blastococcus haudaquaticus]SOD98827.1 FBP C-terminal treble-clef zinc-finger [Blastococcus haudaquaticus]